jgi:transposase-like protein
MWKKRYFSPETKLEVVRRYAAGERPGVLGDEYGIRATLVHQWATAYRLGGEAGLRGCGRPSQQELAARLMPNASEESADQSLGAAQRRIALLERKIAQQGLELDFFKLALRHFETSPPPAERPGATAPIPSSGNKRNRKAD